MSQSTQPPTQFGIGYAAWIKNNPELIAELPEPSEKWIWADTDFTKGELQSLRRQGVIQKLGWVDDRESDGHEWQTHRGAYEWAMQRLENTETFPCGHKRGFRTIDAERGIYECGYDHCSRRYNREIVERVMGE